VVHDFGLAVRNGGRVPQLLQDRAQDDEEEVKHLIIAAAAAALFVGLALAAGVHQRAAVLGAGISSATALASLIVFGFTARRFRGNHAALAVYVLTFLVRIVLVAIGAALVARTGESTVAFILAFFVSYFVFSGIEAAYLHSLRHTTGPTA
jgi:hypothetical protein